MFIPKSKKRLAAIVLGIFLLLYLLAVLIYWRGIEKDLANRINYSLQNNTVNFWGSIATQDNGRDVTLLGVAPSQRKLDEAMALINNVWGVRIVNFKGSVAPIRLYKPFFSLAMVNQAVRIEGEIGRDSSSVVIVKELKSLSKNRSFSNLLQLSDRVKPLPGLVPLLRAAQCCKRLNLIKIQDDKVLIKGEVSDISQKEFFLGRANDLFGQAYTIKSDIKIVLESLESNKQITKMQCQKKFNRHLAKEKIKFVSSAMKVERQSDSLLKKLADIAGQCKKQSLHIVGHTDATGTKKLNDALSAGRANAVKEYLVKLGVQSARLSSEGKGSSKPIASNKTRAGRANNRRVQIVVE